MVPLAEIQAARERTFRHIQRTPLVRSSTLSARFGSNVYLKLELFQKTGSFKPRGAFNQLMVLREQAGATRFVGASGGNFAQGLAYAGAVLGLPVTVVMPADTPPHYVRATQGYGAAVELVQGRGATWDRVAELAVDGTAATHAFDQPAMMAGDARSGWSSSTTCPTSPTSSSVSAVAASSPESVRPSRRSGPTSGSGRWRPRARRSCTTHWPPGRRSR